MPEFDCCNLQHRIDQKMIFCKRSIDSIVRRINFPKRV